MEIVIFIMCCVIIYNFVYTWNVQGEVNEIGKTSADTINALNATTEAVSEIEDYVYSSEFKKPTASNSTDAFTKIASEMLDTVKRSLGEGDEVNTAYVKRIEELETQVSDLSTAYDGLTDVILEKEKEIKELKDQLLKYE